MAKIRLGARPTNFKRVVTVPMHDGTDGLIEVSYKYRTLTEFGTLLDEYGKQAKAEVEAVMAANDAKRKEAKERGETYVEPMLTNEEMRREQAKATADYLLLIMDGWNLDVGFSPETVFQLCDELPAAASKIIGDYREAIAEGRLGN